MPPKTNAPAIQLTGITKHYGSVIAVDALHLCVEQGEIYGFLGLNGAGKTTTIRAILGMVRPTAGAAMLLGEPVGPRGRGPWRRVGHLVESPAPYPNLTTRENLELARRLYGLHDPLATDRALDRFALTQYAGRRAGTLSMGNLQRLALARALLHDPDLLVLDEPANGLDPAGVVEVRDLLRSLADERGATIFMSSHILSEVDRLATRIGIIHHGRLIAELTMRELEQRRQRKLVVDARNRAGARTALLAAGYKIAQAQPDGRITVSDAAALEAPDAVARILTEAGAPPTHLAIEQEDLEQYFLRLTGDAT